MKYKDVVNFNKQAAEEYIHTPDMRLVDMNLVRQDLSSARDWGQRNGRIDAQEDVLEGGIGGAALGGAAGLLAGIILGATSKEDKKRKALRYGALGGLGGIGVGWGIGTLVGANRG